MESERVSKAWKHMPNECKVNSISEIHELY